jgi:RNA polymerase sigma-70 factor, ECF subfamily
MHINDEEALIERAKTDGDSFGELYDAYYPKIFNYVLRRVGVLELAEDITTEVFLKALARIQRFTWRGLPFSAWLYRIAANEIAEHFRGKHTKNISLDMLMEEQGFEPVDESDVAADYAASQEAIARHQQFLQVQQALLQLPVKYQEAVSLRYFEKKSIAEIAQIMGKRPGTIKSLLSRGIQKLRQALPGEPVPSTPSATFLRSTRLLSGDKKS